MSVVYLVCAHRDPNLVAGLARALSPSRVLVHIDANVSDDPFRRAAVGLDNVHFLEHRVEVHWSGWSQVEMALALMSAAEHALGDDDYAVLLSGDSFPLQPPSTIERYLRDHRGRQYMSCVPMPVPGAEKLVVRAFGSMSRLARVQLERDSRAGGLSFAGLVNRLEIRRPYRGALGGRAPFGGGQWWTLTGGAIRWLIAQAHGDRRFRRLCRTIAVPDEFFLPTLLMNSPFADAVGRSLMYTDWTKDSGWSPATLTEGHVDRFASAGLFAKEVLADDFLDHHARVGLGDDERAPVLFARKLDDPATAQRIQDVLWPLDLVGAEDRIGPDRSRARSRE